MQILGNLYPHNPAKAHKAVSHFRDAAGRSDRDPEIWEMLGELLAPTDPSGWLPHLIVVHSHQLSALTHAEQTHQAQVTCSNVE